MSDESGRYYRIPDGPVFQNCWIDTWAQGDLISTENLGKNFSLVPPTGHGLTFIGRLKGGPPDLSRSTYEDGPDHGRWDFDKQQYADGYKPASSHIGTES